jgi:nitrile hydratase
MAGTLPPAGRAAEYLAAMDSVHDIGGMQGFGPVAAAPDEPPFHEPWEGRVHGLMLASSLAVGGGGLRTHIERMGSAAYLSTSYYEHWLAGIESRILAQGAVTADELTAKQAEIAGGAAVPEARDAEAGAFVRSLFAPFEIEEHEAPPPRFGPGDRVRVKRMHPAGHTRCPRYVRGARGTIALVHPAQPLPDRATQDERHVEAFYSVAFAPAELWGADAEPGAATIVVDLWESYLEDEST